MNKEIPQCFGDVKRKPKFLDSGMLKMCNSVQDSILLCVDASQYRFDNKKLAKLLDISPSHFSMMLSGKRHFPLNKLPELMCACGNLAPVQYLCEVCGLPLEMAQKLMEMAA